MALNVVPWDEYKKTTQKKINAVPMDENRVTPEELKKTLTSSGGDALSQFQRGAYNTLADTGNFLLELPIKGINKLTELAGGPKNYIPEELIPLDKEKPLTVAGKVGNILGSGAGLAIPGSATAKALEATESIPALSRLTAPFRGKGVASRIARNTAGQALAGAATNPEDRAGGAEFGALFSLGSDGGLGAGKYLMGRPIKKAIKYGKGLLGNAPGKQQALETMVADPENTLTVNEITGAKPLQEKTSKDAGKYLNAIMHRIRNSLENLHGQAKTLLHYYIPNNVSPGAIKSFLHNKVFEAAQEAIQNNNKLYEKAAEEARKKGFKMETPAFNAAVNKHIANIKKAREEQGAHSLEPHIGYLKKFLPKKSKKVEERYIELPNGEKHYFTQDSQDEAKQKSFDTVHDTLKSLSQKVNSTARQGQGTASHHFSELLDALKSDMDNINPQGINDVSDLIKTAREDYKRNVVPFRKGTADSGHKDLYRHLSTLPTTDSQLAKKLVQDNYADVLRKLDDETRKAIIYDLASSHRSGIKNFGRDYQQEFDLLPGNLSDFFSKMQQKNPEVYKNIIKPHEHKEIVELQRLNKANEENKIAFKKPPTGWRGEPSRIKHHLLTSLGHSATVGAVGAGGHAVGEGVLLPMALTAAIMGGKGLSNEVKDRFLRSKQAKNMLRRALNGEEMLPTPRADAVKTLLQSIASTQGGSS